MTLRLTKIASWLKWSGPYWAIACYVSSSTYAIFQESSLLCRVGKFDLRCQNWPRMNGFNFKTLSLQWKWPHRNNISYAHLHQLNQQYLSGCIYLPVGLHTMLKRAMLRIGILPEFGPCPSSQAMEKVEYLTQRCPPLQQSRVDMCQPPFQLTDDVT